MIPTTQKKTIKEELEDSIASPAIPKEKKSLKEIFEETSAFIPSIKPSEPLLELISSLEVKGEITKENKIDKIIETIEAIKVQEKSIDIEKIRLLMDLGVDKIIIAEELGFPVSYFKEESKNGEISSIREEMVNIREEIKILTANFLNSKKELTEHLEIKEPIILEATLESTIEKEAGILIPEDLEVDVTIIRSKTGKKYLIKENAAVAVKQTQETLDKLDALVEKISEDSI